MGAHGGQQKIALTTSTYVHPSEVPLRVYTYESSTLGKTYGIKVWCYWEQIGNLMMDVEAAVFCMISMINHVAS
jgi:hypothetical protein